MLISTVSIPWLFDLAEGYRTLLKDNSPFYKTLAAASSPSDLQWVYQLYYICYDFALAMSLRYSGCTIRLAGYSSRSAR